MIRSISRRTVLVSIAGRHPCGAGAVRPAATAVRDRQRRAGRACHTGAPETHGLDRQGSDAGRHGRHGQAARARRAARQAARQGRRQGHHRRICLDDLPALRAFPQDDAAGAEDEIHRHRQGAADLARIPLRSARRGRFHAGPLRRGQLLSRWSTCSISSRKAGPAWRTPRMRCCRSPSWPVLHRRSSRPA